MGLAEVADCLAVLNDGKGGNWQKRKRKRRLGEKRDSAWGGRRMNVQIHV
jgi:hypothetical protein